MTKDSLIGPRAHERQFELKPYEVRLEDKSPLYYIFLENPDALTLSAAEVHAAKQRLSEIIVIDRNKVLSCHGKTYEEAKKIIESIEFPQTQRAA